MRALKLTEKVTILIKDKKEEYDLFVPLDLQEAFKIVYGSRVIPVTFDKNLPENLKLVANVLERLMVELKADVNEIDSMIEPLKGEDRADEKTGAQG